ncbi:hypothetical protein CJ026_025925 [Ralstonia pickettii]|nr:hypothetical protein CJ026_025925 [Ralstonia pickettii]
MSAAQNLAWEFTVAAEVERRVTELRQAAALSAAADAPSRERQEVREAAAELCGDALADVEHGPHPPAACRGRRERAGRRRAPTARPER